MPTLLSQRAVNLAQRASPMLDLATVNNAAPTRQAIAAEDRTRPGKVTGKLKRAMDAMIWEGLTRDAAAEKAGMSIHGLREALKRPHVRAYYASEIVVLRENERARNIHALVQVRDQTGNQMARVQAVKALEQISDDAANGAGSLAPNASPGLTIRIIHAAPSGHADVGQPVTVVGRTIDHPGQAVPVPTISQVEPGGQK